jgi:uncharacterized phage protein gp47/JayE
MPFTTPALPDLNDQAATSIEAELPGSDARLRRSNLNVLGRVMAGFAHGFYGYLRRFLEECLPWSQGFLLEMWTGIWGVYRKAAFAAGGNVVFTGTNGALIAAGTALQTADGQVVETTAAAAIAGGVATVAVLAVEPGSAGNVAAGALLSLINPVAGVVATATVDIDGISNGSDIESTDDLYARFLARVRSPAHGGSATDYIAWALEVEGVTRAWVVPNWSGVGSVLVLFVRDGDGVGANFPNAAAIALVQAHIDLVRPVTADVTVAAPIAKTVNLMLSVTPNTQAVRDAVAANIVDLFLREADVGASLVLSHINRDISLASGETDHILSAPGANVACAANEMAVLGTITWI